MWVIQPVAVPYTVWTRPSEPPAMISATLR